MVIIKKILNSFLFWGAWIVVPLLMEIIPALGSVLLLLRRRKKIAASGKPILYPDISIIIPVYNSADTLYDCVASIAASTYPKDRIRIFLAYNQGQDDSFSVFARCQKAFPDLKMQWLTSEQGKSRALNLSLYNSEGKYIINMDSDGVLEPSALANLVDKFEANPDLNCMTGTILTIPEKIQAYKGFFARLLRNLEFVEYAQAFLAGRSYASETNSVYTLSGAFSAFRKSAVLKSWMYNTETISEDTHITFQMRYHQNERVEVCENAIFFVDPIESVNKLYTQRQRWQRGSLEVSKMFMGKKFRPARVFKDVSIRTLLYDHTFAFPRLIWYLALICLMAMNYSGNGVLVSTAMIFGMYMLIGIFYFFAVQHLLKLSPPVRKYYLCHWWCVFLLPFFNLAVFFIRLAGIINSISTNSAWRTRDLTEEREALGKVIREDFNRPRLILERVRKAVNRQEGGEGPEAGAAAGTAAAASHRALYSAGWYFAVGGLFFLGGLMTLAVYWSKKTFNMSANELINVLTGPVEGTGQGMIAEILTGLGIPLLLVLLAVVLLSTGDRLLGGRLGKRPEERKRAVKAYRSAHRLAAFLGAVFLLFGAVYTNYTYDLIDYYALKGSQTTIYEDRYADPHSVAVTAPAQKKNLIYIYVESLETAYASEEEGGSQPVNYMPRLTELARDNVSFSPTEKLGGLYSPVGANWTMGALLSSTSGVHYSRAEELFDIDRDALFYPGLTALGDILEENGYRQMFLCGSDAYFGARRNYFETHGNYEICDLFTIREKGYVPADYHHSWGIEDKVLFDVAKKELSGLAEQGEPFNFTMLTVDLHAPHGYLCEWCGDEYNTTAANVIECNDRYITEFIDWCKKQDFYKDSVIVLLGDHPRRDTDLVEGIPYEERAIYNCFINSDTPCERDPGTRQGTTVDMFPTTLAALGFTIEGDQLGLGVNLFSDKQTLREERGLAYLDVEFGKLSEYYRENFVK